MKLKTNRTIRFFQQHWASILLGMMVIVYIWYFSWTSLLRLNTLNAHYFDLGIMHQTTHNTFRSFTTGDSSMFLELTDPYGPNQIKRMAIHNDMILALLAPLYSIHDGPETLLIIQTVVLALGAVGLYLIGRKIFPDYVYGKAVSLFVAAAYLFYPALHFSNLFDFHGVVLSTGFLIFMFYFWLDKRFICSFVMFVLAILTKEQVALTTAFFGLYILYTNLRDAQFNVKKTQWSKFGLVILITSIVWFLLIMKVVIPGARGGRDHFALNYYEDFGDSPISVITGLLFNPLKLWEYATSPETTTYLNSMFFPVGFVSFLALPVLAVSAPEFGVVLLSNNPNLRNLYYHYSAVITPFVFISALFALRWIHDQAQKNIQQYQQLVALAFGALIFALSLYASLTYGPLSVFRRNEMHSYGKPAPHVADVMLWKDRLADKSLKVAATGKIAPFFTSRRYFYLMSDRYDMADYVVVNVHEVRTSYGSQWAIPGYEELLQDERYKKIYDTHEVEVFQKIQR